MRLEPIALFVVFAWGVLAVAELAGVGEKSQYGIRLFLDTISINYDFQMQSKGH
jgi:hypothetical protein